jgi:hypothetical protein
MRMCFEFEVGLFFFFLCSLLTIIYKQINLHIWNGNDNDNTRGLRHTYAHGMGTIGLEMHLRLEPQVFIYLFPFIP